MTIIIQLLSIAAAAAAATVIIWFMVMNLWCIYVEWTKIDELNKLCHFFGFLVIILSRVVVCVWLARTHQFHFLQGYMVRDIIGSLLAF